MEQQNTSNKLSITFWIIAFIITAFTGYFQRVTGPSYPLSGSSSFQGKDIFYKFERSSSSNENCLVKVQVGDDKIQGVLIWKRYKTNDELSRMEMKNINGVLIGELPKQPPAGKLQYYVRIISGNTESSIPKEPVIVRFKGDVPLPIMALHISIMFIAMLFSTRTGMEIFRKEPNLKKLSFITLGLLTLGGLILGPIALKYAFGMYWEGIPYGFDLTDNKTLIIWLVWVVAAFMNFKSKKPKYWVLGAAVLTILVFLIPHSLFGTELDYSKI